ILPTVAPPSWCAGQAAGYANRCRAEAYREMARPLRVLLDGTPLLGARTGIGRYTASVFEELAALDDVDSRAVAFTLRGWRRLRKVLPHDTRARGMPVSARALRKAWL